MASRVTRFLGLVLLMVLILLALLLSRPISSGSAEQAVVPLLPGASLAIGSVIALLATRAGSRRRV